jgi:ABC-2 type transport system permease protein
MRASESFHNVTTIFRRELGGYFSVPMGYVFLVFFLFILGFFTFNVSRFFETGHAGLEGFFQWHPWVFALFVPAVSMRMWAEERRMGTIELILTFPFSLFEVVLGKFLAAWAFIGIALCLTFPMPLTAIYLGSPDMGAVVCGYLGSFLMAGAFLSVGTMASAMTRSQVIGFIVAVVISFFFILAGYPPVTDTISGWAPAWLVDMASGVSIVSHFASMSRGVLDIRDVIYYASIIFFMLFANSLILQNRKAA